MYKATASSLRLRSFTSTATRAARNGFRPLSTTPRQQGIISKDRDDTLDPSKEATATTSQAKDQSGSNPAAQHAKVSGHQDPKGDGQYQSQGSKTSPGLGSKHAEQGKKPGEEAVNPAVKS